MLALCCLVLVAWASLAGAGAEDNLNFLVVGDWGGQPSSPYYTAAEQRVSEAMAKKAVEIKSQFSVGLGDNFYDYGVKNVDDPRFKETFEDVFTADSLQSTWYMVCGNHDHYGNASAEVAYTSHSKRWHMPNYYYTQTFTIPGSGSTVQLVMIDTVILAGRIDFRQVGAQPMGPFSISWAEDQWAWIEQTLKSSTADWLIVGGHYPVWSVAEHGPTQTLVDRLKPMLEKYNVSAYFCGHDHNLQYIQEDDSSVSYFVTGGGHLSDPSLAHESDIPKGSLKFHYGPIDLLHKLGGFSTVSFGSQLNVTFFDNMGKQLYSVSRPKLRKRVP